MEEARSLFDLIDSNAEAAADARAEADIAAGRVVSHESMTKWLKSWGTDRPLPRPQIGD